MKLKLLLSRRLAPVIMTAVMAAFISGCGKTNQTTEQNATNETPKQSEGNQAAEKAATAAAQKWLAGMDNGQYGQSWLDASAFFQGAVPEQKWESALTAVRKPLGDLESRNLKSAEFAAHLPDAPAGKYVVMQFDTSFANKKSAIETVTFSLESNGEWKASGYYIK